MAFSRKTKLPLEVPGYDGICVAFVWHFCFTVSATGFEASSEIKWVRPPTQWTDGDRSGAHIFTAGKLSDVILWILTLTWQLLEGQDSVESVAYPSASF